jgi:hypothetical protein
MQVCDMKRLERYGVLIDLLILLVLIFSLTPSKTVQAQGGAQGGYNYTNITTGTTTIVKGANGTLHTIVVGSGTATLTIVDTATNSSGCSGGTAILTTGATAQPQVYTFDLQFTTGLCITTSATTNLVVTWR